MQVKILILDTWLVVDGGWSVFEETGICDDNCTSQLVRYCERPVPVFGGTDCSGIDTKDTLCNNCTVGCFDFIEYTGLPIDVKPLNQFPTVFECQQKCQVTAGCDMFMLVLPDSDLREGCHLKKYTNETTDNLDFMVLSGPKTCPGNCVFVNLAKPCKTMQNLSKPCKIIQNLATPCKTLHTLVIP
jgi:hypothetical protein